MSSYVSMTCWTAYYKDEWEVMENVCWGCGYMSDYSEPHPKYWPSAGVAYPTGITVE